LENQGRGKQIKIIIIDDERDTCLYLAAIISNIKLQYEDIFVFQSYSGLEALSLINDGHFDIIISDISLPDISGIEIAQKAIKLNQDQKIVLISGNEDIIRSINSMEMGIFDFLTKPIDLNKLIKIIKKVSSLHREKGIDVSNLFKNNDRFISFNEIQFPNYDNKDEIGIFSEKMQSIYNKINKILEYPQIPILIRGETGTGKEVLAQYTHNQYFLKASPFIAINCSNLSRELFESELFGYEKGSFTGADPSGKEGKIKAAGEGTLFLDEVGEIPLEMQSKLLRVIETREYYKIGGNKKQLVKARFVFATNRDLTDMIKKRQFREDLYYRLNLCEVKIPPLRERKEEIIPLSLFMIKKITKELDKPIKNVEKEALKLLENHSFPGNIREMKNLITKAVLFTRGDTIYKKDVQDIMLSGERKEILLKINPDQIVLPDQPFNLIDLENAIIIKTLKKFNGNKTKTATFLGLTRIQLYGRFRDISTSYDNAHND
jgi:DNA-binding NtrC family response regulator